MANMREVAKRANVSVSTVSNVLSGKKYVSPAVKNRVDDALLALGYESENTEPGPYAAAQGVALILQGVYSSFFHPFLSGAQDAATEAGYTLILHEADRNFEKEESGLFSLAGRGIRNFVIDTICPQAQEDAYFERIRAELVEGLGACVAIVSRKVDIAGICSVYVDNHQSAYFATEHLIEMGHRRIAHIAGSDAFPHSALRKQGYRQALIDHGIQVDEHLIVDGDFTPISGYAAMDGLLSKGIALTAVFSANDQMAVGAIKAIQQQGLSVPEDVAVAGFDNLNVSSLVSPGLTTVQYPIYQMGYLALSNIAKSRMGEKLYASTELPARLIVRRSTDPMQKDDWNLKEW